MIWSPEQSTKSRKYADDVSKRHILFRQPYIPQSNIPINEKRNKGRHNNGYVLLAHSKPKTVSGTIGLLIIIFTALNYIYEASYERYLTSSLHTFRRSVSSSSIYGSPERLFVCGSSSNVKTHHARNWMLPRSYGIHLLKGVFPEIINTHHPLIISNPEDITERYYPVNNDDIMVIYWGMYDCQIHPDTFPGKTVIFSGEAGADEMNIEPGQRVYYIGPKSTGRQSLMIPYLILKWNTMKKNMKTKITDPSKKKIGNGGSYLLYAQSHCIEYRERAFDSLIGLSKESPTRGGSCWGYKHDPSHVSSNLQKSRSEGANGNSEVYNNYRFALVMENALEDGYMSEKLLNAYLGGSIPIYYGSKLGAASIFNPKSFVYYDIHDPNQALNQVEMLEKNHTAYEAMLHNEPILLSGDSTVKKWFSLTDDFGDGFMKKRIRSMMGYDDPMIHLSQLTPDLAPEMYNTNDDDTKSIPDVEFVA